MQTKGSVVSVHSWLMSVVRVIAKFYAWLAAIGLAFAMILLTEKIGAALFGDPTSYVFEVGFEHPPLAASAHLTGPGSPLVVSTSSPALGSVLSQLHDAVLVVAYPAAVIWLALRALDLARAQGLFCDGLPRRLSLLGWVLVAQSVWALVQSLTIAYLRSQVLAATTFSGEFGTAFTASFAWPAMAAGAGVLLLRSIIVEGVGMRRDLDGTV